MFEYPILQNNPFRVLGCYGNASTIEISAAYNTILNKIETGEPVSSNIDYVDLLGHVERTKENVDNAYRLLSNLEIRRKYSMYSPWKGNAADDLYLDNLSKGIKIDVTTEFKDRTPASFQNEVYACLLLKDYPEACYKSWMTNFYYCGYNEEYRKALNITAKGQDEQPFVTLFVKVLVSEEFCTLSDWKSIVSEQIIEAYKASFSEAINKVCTGDEQGFDTIRSLYSTIYNDIYGKMYVLKNVIDDQNELANTIDTIYLILVDLCISMMNDTDEIKVLENSFTFEHCLKELFNDFPHKEIVKSLVKENEPRLSEIINNAPDYQQRENCKTIMREIEAYSKRKNKTVDDAIDLTKSISLNYVNIKYHFGRNANFDRIFSEKYVGIILENIEPFITENADENTIINIKVLLMYLNNMSLGTAFKYGEYDRVKTKLEQLIDKKHVKHAVGKAHERYDDRLFEGDLNFMSYRLFTDDDYEMFKERFPFMAELGYKRLKENQRAGKTRQGIRSTLDKILGRYPIEKIIEQNIAKQAEKSKTTNFQTSTPPQKISSPRKTTANTSYKPHGPLSFETARIGDKYSHTIHYDERKGNITFFMSKTVECYITDITPGEYITVRNVDEKSSFKVFPGSFEDYQKI